MATKVAPEHPVERTLYYMQRQARRAFANDTGDLLGIGQIKQMLGTRDDGAVRGYLIKLVASGDVECLECINGIYWRLAGKLRPVNQIEPEKVDGHFTLQREIMDDPRGLWFDAETFTNSKRAAAALQFAKWEAEYRAREQSAFQGFARRIQGVRLVSKVSL